MQEEIENFLNLHNFPERLTVEQTAWVLGFSVHEIPILVSKNVLKPLGHPAHNGPKYFLTANIEDLRRDEKWHGRAADAILQFWRDKNARRRNSSGHHLAATSIPDAQFEERQNQGVP